ncbi:hypothetical protein B0I72DRAFT_137573 [Yarrowia lipolytica]|nr:hypothetical protein B0I72DRAFT_137573 [Yarrowia lipolytica]
MRRRWTLLRSLSELIFAFSSQSLTRTAHLTQNRLARKRKDKHTSPGVPWRVNWWEIAWGDCGRRRLSATPTRSQSCTPVIAVFRPPATPNAPPISSLLSRRQSA